MEREGKFHSYYFTPSIIGFTLTISNRNNIIQNNIKRTFSSILRFTRSPNLHFLWKELFSYVKINFARG